MIFIEYCPPGWRATKNVCLKTIETSNNINYEQALATCQDPALGDTLAYPMEPFSEYLHNELKTELENSTLTETEFWIGKYFLHNRQFFLFYFDVCGNYMLTNLLLGINYTDNNVWAEKASWEFVNGVRIMDFHYNKWAST